MPPLPINLRILYEFIGSPYYLRMLLSIPSKMQGIIVTYTDTSFLVWTSTKEYGKIDCAVWHNSEDFAIIKECRLSEKCGWRRYRRNTLSLWRMLTPDCKRHRFVLGKNPRNQLPWHQPSSVFHILHILSRASQQRLDNNAHMLVLLVLTAYCCDFLPLFSNIQKSL